MKITQIRNATLLIEAAGINTATAGILVDPMFAPRGTLPKLKYYKSRQRNPLVELPSNINQLRRRVTDCLITHCQKGHFDHLDRSGVKWLRQNGIKTFCTQHDADYLMKKGIHVQALQDNQDTFLGGQIRQVPAVHTRGWLTPFMEHGVGYFIELQNEPSLYLMGDTVLTDEIREFIAQTQPDVIVAPTGKAQFDLGAPLLLDESEIIELAELSTGTIIANHMNALDHCRITRADLADLLQRHHQAHRFIIPADGETVVQV